MPDSDTDVSELARQVVDELDTGTAIGDKMILSRRQLLGIAGGGLSAGALSTLGVGEAQAQEAAGAIGTESEPVDVFGADGRFQALEAEDVKLKSTETVEIDVPNDKGTIQSAIEYASQKYNSRQSKVVINIQTGHEIQETIMIGESTPFRCVNLGHVTITSEDDTVTVSSSFDGGDLLNVSNRSTAPVWDIYVDCDDVAGRMRVERGSSLYITDGSGCENSTTRGLDVGQGGFVYGTGVQFRNNSGHGVSLSNRSYGVFTGESISENNSESGFRFSESIADIEDCITQNNNNRGIDVDEGSTVNASLCLVNSNDDNVRVRRAGKLNIRDSIIQNSDDVGLLCFSGAQVNARDCEITNSGGHGVNAWYGSHLNLAFAEIKDSEDDDIRTNRGSIITANNAETTSSEGGSLEPNSADTNQDFNTLTGDGVIFA